MDTHSPNTITEKKQKGKKIIIRKRNKKKVNDPTKLNEKNTGSKEEKMTTHSPDPKFNSHEAFAEWFLRFEADICDIEENGKDLEEVMKLWCSKNNHRYEEDGVYNDNIQSSCTITEKKQKAKKIIIRKPNKKKVNEEKKLNEKNSGSKEEKMTEEEVFSFLNPTDPELICSKCPLPLTEDDMAMGDGTMCEDCYDKEQEEVETNCHICGDYMSDVDEDDYKEGCNVICDSCDPPPQEEEDEEKCSKCGESDDDIHECWKCDVKLCVDCDENEMATYGEEGHTYCADCGKKAEEEEDEDKKIIAEYNKFKEQVNKDFTTALAYAFGISNGFSQKCVSKYALDNISDEIEAFMDAVNEYIKKEWRIKIFNQFYGDDYVWFNGEPLERDYFEGEYPKMVDKEGNKIIKLESGEYITQKKKIKLNVVKK